MKGLAAFTFLLISGCAPTLAGQLKDPAGTLVVSSDARVNIVGLGAGKDAAPPVIVNVGKDGSFMTRADLPPGEYLVEALVPGYALASTKVRVGERDHVEIVLQPVGTPKPGPVSANTELDAGRGAGGATLMPPSL